MMLNYRFNAELFTWVNKRSSMIHTGGERDGEMEGQRDRGGGTER